MKKMAKILSAALICMAAGCMEKREDEMITEYAVVESAEENSIVIETEDGHKEKHFHIDDDSGIILIRDYETISPSCLKRSDRLLITEKDGEIRVIQVVDSEAEN